MKHSWKWEGLGMCRREGNHSEAELVKKEKKLLGKYKQINSISNSIGNHTDLAVL